MQLVKADTKRLKKDFIDFYYRVYAQLSGNRDNFNHAAANFLYRKDSFSRNCFIEPVLVSGGGQFTVRGIFLHHPGLDALQLGFFEALPDQAEAVELLLERAVELASERGLGRIIIGLNGHLVYGVGFLNDRQDLPAAFDGVYSPEYYSNFFNKRGFIEHTLSTYQAETASFSPSAALSDRAYDGVTYRNLRFGDFKREVEILGDLFNRTLAGTRFYFPREIQESYEMLRTIRPLLKPGNIIFAMKGGREIGFVIWHPNFNELLPDNRRVNPLLFFLKCRLFGGRLRHIKEFRVNTIGVLPEYENSGASLGLIHEVFRQVNQLYSGGETSFVWDDNHKSSLFCKALCSRRLRSYVAYEWILPETGCSGRPLMADSGTGADETA